MCNHIIYISQIYHSNGTELFPELILHIAQNHNKFPVSMMVSQYLTGVKCYKYRVEFLLFPQSIVIIKMPSTTTTPITNASPVSQIENKAPTEVAQPQDEFFLLRPCCVIA